MRAAKAAKDLQSAAGDLAERLCHAVAAEVGSFNEVLGSELPAEQQVSYSAFLTKQALPVISDLLRFLCCEQPEDPAAAVLLRLAKPRCNGLVMAELRAALREKGEPSELEEEASLRQAVPLPPGRPGSSPRRSTSRLLSRGTKRLELPVEEPARSSSGVSAGSQDSDPTLMVDKTMSLPASAHARGAARPGSFRRNERKRITTDLTQSALRGIPLSFEETVQNLRKVPLLAELTDKDMERVAEISRIQVFEQDEVMINYGAPMDTLHILLSGSANISVPQPAGTVSVGDFMGVEALQAPRTKATSQLTAGPEVRTLSIPRSAFEELNLMQRKLKREERLKASKQQTAAKKESLMTSVVSGDGRCSVTGHDLVLNYEKTEDDRQMIAKGLKSNKVLSEVLGLTHEQCEEVVNGTHLIEVQQGAEVFKKGDIGTALFVVQAGMLKVDLGSIEVVLHIGDTFGELALLYDEPRSATILATRTSRLWVLPRIAFKEMLQETAVHKTKEFSCMLHSVPSIREQVNWALMSVMAGSVEETLLYEDEVVCVKGEDQGVLFLVYSGSCAVTDAEEDFEGKKGLMNGDWVGERQLVENIPATRTVKVTSERAVILSVDHYHFELAMNASQDASLMKQVKDVGRNHQELSHWLKRRRWSICNRRPSTNRRASLKDCTIVGALGEGSFGSVLLMRDKEDQAREYALKRLDKQHLAQEKQESMVKNERSVLMQLDSAFVVNLFGCYHDEHSVYLLLEAALGGELFDIYTDHNLWGDAAKAAFYVACVALGLSHLHEKHVIWRDLKLENCLLTSKGYVKLTDMGIAKMVTGKTFTVCGTADYFAPETLKQVGHNRAVDWWALGVMLFIMIAGHSPFDAPEVTQIYKNIIRGLSKVQFPAGFSPEAEECVRSLCRKKPEDRITMQRGGIQNLWALAFFNGMNWEAVQDQTWPPPFVPETDYDKISNRQLSRHVHIVWEGLQPWAPEAEEELAMGHAGSMARSTSAMSMSSRHGSPRLSAKPSQVKWQDQEGDVFALSGT